MKTTANKKRTGTRMLVPVDFSAATANLLAYARKFARQKDMTITVLHIVEPFHADWHMDTTDLQRQRRDQAARALRELIAREFPRSGRARGELRTGHPVEVITRFARQTGTNIILIATHGRSGLKRAWLGSVAERVVRHASCPVLVVR